MKSSILLIISCSLTLTNCAQTHQPMPAEKTEMGATKPEAEQTFEVNKSEAEWLEQLGPEAYKIMREKGTECAFSGDSNPTGHEGTYYCTGCQLALFESNTKFDSGTGWPSFHTPISESNVRYIPDSTLGMVRTEVVCNRCGSHLGHVFEDGPNPSGMRYCVNSVSLTFVPETK